MAQAKFFNASVAQHFWHPLNVGVLAQNDANIRSVTIGQEDLGQVLRLQIQLLDGVIAATRFQAYGCPATIATGSWLSEQLKGLSLEQAKNISSQDIVQALELSSDKMHCAFLALDAIDQICKD